MKKINDFSQYKDILPYVSEIFGVYQPMLGWRSRKIRARIEKGFSNDLSRAFESLYKKFKGRFEFTLDERLSLDSIRQLSPATLSTAETRFGGGFVMENIARSLPPLEQYDDSVWDQAIQPKRLQDMLTDVVVPQTMKWHKTALSQAAQYTQLRSGAKPAEALNHQVAQQLNRESAVAGFMLYLKANNHFDALKKLFYKPDNHLTHLLKVLSFRDPLDYMDPFKDLDRVSLSPIGIVHLFRQYFFEFDTFLGPPRQSRLDEPRRHRRADRNQHAQDDGRTHVRKHSRNHRQD